MAAVWHPPHQVQLTGHPVLEVFLAQPVPVKQCPPAQFGLRLGVLFANFRHPLGHFFRRGMRGIRSPQLFMQQFLINQAIQGPFAVFRS